MLEIFNTYGRSLNQKAKYIKKNNIFNFGDKKLNCIYDFLCFVNGFKNQSEFRDLIKNKKNTKNDSRLDFLSLDFKPNIEYQTTRTIEYFIDEYTKKTFSIKNINFLNSLYDAYQKDQKNVTYFWVKSELENIEENIKLFSKYRSLSLIETSSPTLVLFSNIKNNYSEDIISSLITKKIKNKHEITVFNNLDFNIELPIRSHKENNICSFLSNKIKTYIENNSEIKQKETIFILLNNDAFEKEKGMAVLTAQAKNLFNVIFITDLDTLNVDQNEEFYSMWANTEKVFIKTDDIENHLLIHHSFFKNTLTPNRDLFDLYYKKIKELKKGNAIFSYYGNKKNFQDSGNIDFYEKFII
jgi:hypothetical protein